MILTFFSFICFIITVFFNTFLSNRQNPSDQEKSKMQGQIGSAKVCKKMTEPEGKAVRPLFTLYTVNCGLNFKPRKQGKKIGFIGEVSLGKKSSPCFCPVMSQLLFYVMTLQLFKKDPFPLRVGVTFTVISFIILPNPLVQQLYFPQFSANQCVFIFL